MGTGSADPRGNVSIGKGVYRSTDGGKNWSFLGIEKGGQIGRIEIHPTNPDLVYAAVLGNPFGPNAERGVYRSKDGGKNWERVLFVNDKTGAMDLVMDPKNPRILFAGMWQVQRKPWTLIDGGPDGGVYQSRDGGDTWKKIDGGLPQGITGKIGLAISPVNSDRVWALVETPEDAIGGLFRSDDGGVKFTRINGDRELRQRHWYYTHVFADAKDEETVYVNNVSFLKSIDGGKNFHSIPVLHGDCHDLWINPNDPQIMIHSNDGGAHITQNAGKSWSTIYNQPTSEFYRVEVDNQFPYNIYACQQDNSSIAVSSAGGHYGGPNGEEWLTWGGESGHVAVDPRDGTIYSGNYTGEIYRFDVKRGHTKIVTHYPQLHDGLPMYDVKYRYQWNAPITLSTHNPDVLYHCSQYVHKTTDGGQTWEVISPDLTLNKKEYQGLPGGPVQIDYTGVENYNTIFVLEESPLTEGELWAGTDDGLVHITRDGGKTWKKITPAGLPELATVNSIDISKHKKGVAYVTAHNYRLNDFKPYIFKTEDYGATWTSLTNGIPTDWFVRVVREDHIREGLLFCGTEFGIFISFNGGKSWAPFQQNLPRTPITDMVIKRNDLVISTQGRSFWILDDLSALQQWDESLASSPAHLFRPRAAYRTQIRGWGSEVPTPAPHGAVIQFMLKQKPDSSDVIRLEISDVAKRIKRVYSTKPAKGSREVLLKVTEGYNRIVWHLDFPAPEVTPGTVLGYGWPQGPKAAPGTYTVQLTAGGKTMGQNFEVLADPRWKSSSQDLIEQFDLSIKTTEGMTRVHQAIRRIREIRNQINGITERAASVNKSDLIQKQTSVINTSLTDLENKLTQTKSKSSQDPINYPPQFDEQWNWLCIVVGSQDGKPIQGCYDLYQDLKKQSDGYMDQLKSTEDQLKQLNEIILKEGLGGIILKP
ncbi:MAG: VPS10 domain-containing protein [Cyclobacteriaceae bacterium]